jgi:hypothetical protein
MVKIIVEGTDDKKFIEKLLVHLIGDKEIDCINKRQIASYVFSMGGKSKLLDANNKKYINILTAQVESGKIDKILFVFDCDFAEDDNQCAGVNNSEKCFNKLKNDLNWSISIDCSIFNKNLDYFLIGTIKDKECYEYFDCLIECLEIEQIKPNRKPISNLYRELYPYPHFDFKHKNFNEIKAKITTLFS